ncbi:MAG: LD-carboxypeptidase [Candidatus Moraniibacteriota bacterium]|nr:MAG: LD-carboxypeptidase [Candidatus Moranbacteria bacterium]
MKSTYPNKLKQGDEVRVIAPSRSLSIISNESRELATRRLKDLCLIVSFGKHVKEIDDFSSSSIYSRIEDLHEAFLDDNVKAVITVIGGFNSNQLLRDIDWDIIRKNPKILCGFSDVTALNNAILAKSGLVSYSGLHYSSFGQKLHFDYSLKYFKKCLFEEAPIEIESSKEWSDDAWYLDQDNRNLISNSGFQVISEGVAEGTVIGGNLCTLNLLQGTEYMPSLEDSILFLEDDGETQPHHFDRDLQSLIHLPEFSGVKGIVIGRFQKESNMTVELLIKIIKSKKELNDIPVLANADFGHTDPKITFPVGGQVKMLASRDKVELTITKH